MPEQQLVPITFEGGLWNKYAVSVLPDNALQEARNYEMLPNGGLVPRRGWGNWSATSAPASGARATRGMNADYITGGTRYLVWAMDDGSNSMDLYRAAYSTGGALTHMEDVAVTTRTYPVKFAAAEGKLLYAHPGFPNTARLRHWTGSAFAETAAVNNIAGSSLTYHLNRLWSGGATATPSRIHFSAIGDVTSWNTVEGFLDVGKDDGGAIRETCVFDRNLLIGKENGLWLLGGSTLDTFQLYPLNRFLPVANGRSMLPTERGVFVVNEQGVWLWDGASFDEVSTPLDFTLSGAYATLAYADGKLWVQDNGAAFTWVTDGRRWWQEDSEADDIGEVYNWGRYLYGGMKATSTVPAMYRQEPGTTRGAAEVGGVVYGARTPLRWVSPKGKVTVHSVWIRYRQLGGTGTTGCTVTCTAEDATSKSGTLLASGAGVREQRIDLGLVGQAFDITFAQDLSGTDTCHIQIEDMQYEVLVDPRPR